MKYLILFICFTFIVQIVQCKDDTIKTISKSNSSHVELDLKNYSYTTTNSTFEVLPYYPNGTRRTLLLTKTITRKEIVYSTSIQSTISLKAEDCFFDDSIRFMWEINDFGSRCNVSGNTIELISGGCCDAQPTYIYFDLVTGNQLMKCVRPMQELYQYNNKENYSVGLYIPNATIEDSLYINKKDFIGVVHLIVDDSQKHDLVIYSENNNIELFPNISLTDKHQNKLPEKIDTSDSTFYINVSYDIDSKIIIPFTTNGFIEDKIKKPDGIRIEIKSF